MGTVPNTILADFVCMNVVILSFVALLRKKLLHFYTIVYIIVYMKFEYDETKNRANIAKHGLSFTEATLAFADGKRIIEEDVVHSTSTETRYFLYGNTGRGIATVRFTIRNGNIRIIGAGYWRKGRSKYEQG
jgi:uncharacterized DUF497 family protein